MATIPDGIAVESYLGADHSWSGAEIDAALVVQVEDQAKKVRYPDPAAQVPPQAEGWIPDALAEAICRRVHVHLSVKETPLAQVTLTEVGTSQTRAGSPSADLLVRDLELPYRKRFVG